MAKRFFVRAADVAPYHPANHTGTTNRRLIGPETVGAKNVELVLGVIERNQGAEPHAHPGIEQVCYLLEGSAVAEVGGERCEMHPGDSCYFPAGVMHKFTAEPKDVTERLNRELNALLKRAEVRDSLARQASTPGVQRSGSSLPM
ncbi:MAG TPA: cupin domain-containing protein [Burkholderiales bacterium]|jgi:quercetin dioxygenase-like cupin family protein